MQTNNTKYFWIKNSGKQTTTYLQVQQQSKIIIKHQHAVSCSDTSGMNQRNQFPDSMLVYVDKAVNTTTENTKLCLIQFLAR